MGTGIRNDSTAPTGKSNSTMTATSTSTGTLMKGRRQRQWVQELKQRLGWRERQWEEEFKERSPTTATPRGRGIQTALTDNANANRYGNSNNAYRRQLRQRIWESKERSPMTPMPRGRRIQRTLTDDANGKMNRSNRTAVTDNTDGNCEMNSKSGYCQLELEPEDESKQLYSGYGLRQRQQEDEFEEWLPPTATGTRR
jgi:hypothetical protein